MSSPAALRALRHRPLGAVLCMLALAGCGRRHAERAAVAVPLAVQVLADTARARPASPPPPVSVWLVRVDRVKPAPLDVPLPDAPPDTVPEVAPRAAADPALLPPVLIAPAPLVSPAGARGSVELDVQVGTTGEVLATAWAGGSADAALVRAATDCARAMRFLPARRGEDPVAVWCRQRFDFGARGRR